MGVVYSTRLVLASSFTGWEYVQVPGGKRWVVKQIDAYNSSGSGLNAYVQVAGSIVAGATPLASAAFIHYQGMVVLYHGEQIGVYSQSPGISYCISGYQFDDP